MFRPKMPFGKFKGVLLQDIETGYLVWLLDQRIQPGLQFDVETEIMARRLRRIAEEQAARGAAPQRAFRVPCGVNAVVCRELLAAGRRALAQRYHPDRAGGDASAMVAANNSADWLEGLVAELVGGQAR